MEERAKQIAELLRLLANEHRLLILCALSGESLTVGEIHSHTPGISASALSQHLSHLKAAGLVESEKRGLNVIYTLSDRRIAALIDAIKEQYCGD